MIIDFWLYELLGQDYIRTMEHEVQILRQQKTQAFYAPALIYFSLFVGHNTEAAENWHPWMSHLNSSVFADLINLGT